MRKPLAATIALLVAFPAVAQESAPAVSINNCGAVTHNSVKGHLSNKPLVFSYSNLIRFGLNGSNSAPSCGVDGTSPSKQM